MARTVRKIHVMIQKLTQGCKPCLILVVLLVAGCEYAEPEQSKQGNEVLSIPQLQRLVFESSDPKRNLPKVADLEKLLATDLSPHARCVVGFASLELLDLPSSQQSLDPALKAMGGKLVRMDVLGGNELPDWISDSQITKIYHVESEALRSAQGSLFIGLEGEKVSRFACALKDQRSSHGPGGLKQLYWDYENQSEAMGPDMGQ